MKEKQLSLPKLIQLLHDNLSNYDVKILKKTNKIDNKTLFKILENGSISDIHVSDSYLYVSGLQLKRYNKLYTLIK